MKNNKLTTIYIVRHGETDWNTLQKIQGHTDIPLNEKGEQQARDLALELKDIKFDHVFSSDLLRAKRTAEIIALERNLALLTTKALRERSFGKYEGSLGVDFFALFKDWDKLSEEERWNYTVGDEESPEKANTRLINFLRETAVAYNGKTILVVCHGGLMRNILIKFGLATFDTVRGFGNCGYIKLESDGVDFFIKDVKGIQESF